MRIYWEELHLLRTEIWLDSEPEPEKISNHNLRRSQFWEDWESEEIPNRFLSRSQQTGIWSRFRIGIGRHYELESVKTFRTLICVKTNHDPKRFLTWIWSIKIFTGISNFQITSNSRFAVRNLKKVFFIWSLFEGFSAKGWLISVRVEGIS